MHKLGNDRVGLQIIAAVEIEALDNIVRSWMPRLRFDVYQVMRPGQCRNIAIDELKESKRQESTLRKRMSRCADSLRGPYVDWLR
jgi:hypothetical protein